MNESMITLICAVIGSGMATAIVNGIIAKRAEARRVETGESQGMRWLLQDRLEHLAKAYIKADAVSYEEMKNWNKGHMIYHELLKGNGDLNALKTQINSIYLKGEKHE